MSDLQLETHRKNAKTFDFVPVVNVELDDSKWKAQHDEISIEGREAQFLALVTEMLAYNPKQIDAQSGNASTIPQNIIVRLSVDMPNKGCLGFLKIS